MPPDYISDKHPRTAIFGPAASAWYGVLQRHVVLKNTATTVIARVAADQLVFTPVNLFCFLSSMSIMEGTDPMEKLRKAYWSTYKTNLGVWSTVQLGNFALVPLEYRVLVVNVVSLGKSICTGELSCLSGVTNNFSLLVGWNCYLSFVNSKA
jgi:protein Mpv17